MSSGYGGHGGELVYGGEYGHDVVGGYKRGDEQGMRGEGEELIALLQMCKAGSGKARCGWNSTAAMMEARG